jgi:hypothetical protein
MKLVTFHLVCSFMNTPILSAFKRVSSFFAPPPSTFEPFVPPVPVVPLSFDTELGNHLNAELDRYMSSKHICNLCEDCWPFHKKTAVKLMKLHPMTYKELS